MFEIIPEIKTVFDILEKNGFEAYLVGGCVRDYILGKVPSDFDITTNAAPKEMLEVFNGFKIIETGIKHGTVTVVVNGVHFEITTYRLDGKYSDGRHPDEVKFSRTLSDDLQRRDFTVNAMAFNGSLVDLYGGRADIVNKLIRCVGDPDVRFNEDALRILRALRFSSTLEFEIEKNTAESILKNKALLHRIAGERIFSELVKLLSGKNADKVIQAYNSVFEEVFKGTDFALSAEVIKACPDDEYIKLAAFFLHDDSVRDDLRRMKVSNKCFNCVTSIIEAAKRDINIDKPSLKRLMNKYGNENIRRALLLKQSIGEDVLELLDVFDEINDNDECYSLSGLAVTGSDIIDMGIKGEMIGDILSDVLENVIDGRLNNDKTDILKYIKETCLKKRY